MAEAVSLFPQVNLLAVTVVGTLNAKNAKKWSLAVHLIGLEAKTKTASVASEILLDLFPNVNGPIQPPRCHL